MKTAARTIYRPHILEIGELAPGFAATTDGNDRYNLEAVAGRWLVLMFFGSLSEPLSVEALALALSHRDELFDDLNAALFGISVDPADRSQRGIKNSEPGVRFFWDFDVAVTRLYGVADETHVRPMVFLIDPSFRICMAEPIEHTGAVIERLRHEQQNAPSPAEGPTAPVLLLPRVLEPELCIRLIAYFKAGEPFASGFAVDVDGRTVTRTNPDFKRRSDVTIEDSDLIADVRSRIETRLFPMIKRAFGWQAQHIERYLICRYDGADKGFFFPHRDDVTLGTAHRKFAVTLNLNAADYEGGELRFPEFGRRTYKPETGGACVFGCNLLHEATPVTSGIRYAVVPFLYDDAGERLRRANLKAVE